MSLLPNPFPYRADVANAKNVGDRLDGLEGVVDATTRTVSATTITATGAVNASTVSATNIAASGQLDAARLRVGNSITNIWTRTLPYLDVQGTGGYSTTKYFQIQTNVRCKNSAGEPAVGSPPFTDQEKAENMQVRKTCCCCHDGNPLP